MAIFHRHAIRQVLAFAGCFFLASVGEAQGPLGPFGPNSVNWPVAAGGNGHIYEPVAVPASITWITANDAALAAGGHLATITSMAENLFVFSVINDPQFWSSGTGGPWLGGHQQPAGPEPAGGWEWVTGEPMIYTNWREGEPNDANAPGCNQNALHFLGLDPCCGPFPLDVSWAVWDDYFADFAACPGLLGVISYVVEYDVELRCPCTPTGLCASPPGSVCPPGVFTLCVASLSNGSARVQVFDLPAGTSSGKLLISAIPAFPVGSGPFLGLNIDLTLLVPILFAPNSPGNPLSWLIADPGFSPEQPFFVPAGTMSQFAGQTWDMVAVAVVNGSLVLSNYVQRSWP